jgi:hypothetical protein
MTVSGSSSAYQSPAVSEAARAMLVLKKQQDVSKDVGQALVSLIEDAASTGAGRINTYA